MKIHQFSVEEALASLKSDLDGLVTKEVEARLKEYGLNQIDVVRRESLILRFIKECVHFFALILWLAAGLAFFAEYQQPDGGMAILGYAILGVIILLSGNNSVLNAPLLLYKSYYRKTLKCYATATQWRLAVGRAFRDSHPIISISDNRLFQCHYHHANLKTGFTHD